MSHMQRMRAQSGISNTDDVLTRLKNLRKDTLEKRKPVKDTPIPYNQIQTPKSSVMIPREPTPVKPVSKPVEQPAVKAEKSVAQPAAKAEKPVMQPAANVSKPVEQPVAKAEKPVAQPTAKAETTIEQTPVPQHRASLLSGPMTMRRAVIMKEILDKPLALRRR